MISFFYQTDTEPTSISTNRSTLIHRYTLSTQSLTHTAHTFTLFMLLLLCSLFYPYYYLSWRPVTLPCLHVYIYLKYFVPLHIDLVLVIPVYNFILLYFIWFYSSCVPIIYIFLNSALLGRAPKHFIVKSTPIVFGALDKWNVILIWPHLTGSLKKSSVSRESTGSCSVGHTVAKWFATVSGVNVGLVCISLHLCCPSLMGTHICKCHGYLSDSGAWQLPASGPED